MALSDRLAEKTAQSRARIEVDSTGATVTDVPVEGALDGDWGALIRHFGLDPDAFEVVDDTVRMTMRDRDGAGDKPPLRSYSARFRKIRHEMIRPEVLQRWRDDLTDWTPDPVSHVEQDRTYLILVADPQLGKKGTQEAVENWRRGVSAHVRQIRALKPARVHVAFMGDETEGACNNYCVGADEPILTRDLRWVPAGSLKEGDELYTIEEEASDPRKGRKFTPGKVLFNTVKEAPAVKVFFSDGRTLICTPDHPLLVRAQRKHGPAKWAWVKAQDIWDEMSGTAKRTGPAIPKVYEVMSIGKPWEREESWESGWMGGIFDGEGCIPKAKGRISGQLSFAQKRGPVLDRALAILGDRGFSYSAHGRGGATDGEVVSVCINGGHMERMRALGVFAPGRLIGKISFPHAYSSGSNCEAVTITNVEDAGVQKIAMMGTSSRTYFSNGVASHNTNQPHTIELNQSQQLELDFDMRVWTMKQVLATGLPVSASSVISNHGEWTRNGSKDPVTSSNDNASTHIARMTQRLFHELGHDIEWTIGETHPGITLTLGGVECYFSHGYKEKGRGTSTETRTRAAIERQILGRTEELGTTKLWFMAHYHHFYSQEFEGRTLFGCPALEAERSSEYMLDQYGVWSPPGMLGMLVGGSGRGWQNANVF